MQRAEGITLMQQVQSQQSLLFDLQIQRTVNEICSISVTSIVDLTSALSN